MPIPRIFRLPSTPRELAALRKRLEAIAAAGVEPDASLALGSLVCNDSMQQHLARIKQLEKSVTAIERRLNMTPSIPSKPTGA